MALAGRSARRGGAGVRWLGVGVVLTLLILLVDASLHSRSPGPQQQLAGGAWIDRVLPVVTNSTVDGRIVAGIWTNGLKMSGPTISSQLAQVVTGSAEAYDEVAKLRPPANLEGPAGLLEASLYSRRAAAVELQQAFAQVLGASAPGTKEKVSSTTSPLQAVEAADNDLQVGDQTYLLFLHSMPSQLGVSVPSSIWLTSPAPYQPQFAAVFLASLKNSIDPAPVHQVKVYSISTDPAPVSTGATQVLPDASAMTVTVVVADLGNQPEANLTVTATISPAGQGASLVRDYVNLVPGQAYSIVGFGPLNPPQGTPVTLTVTITPPSGSTTAVVTDSIRFEMPAPPPPTTTTPTTTTSAATG